MTGYFAKFARSILGSLFASLTILLPLIELECRAFGQPVTPIPPISEHELPVEGEGQVTCAIPATLSPPVREWATLQCSVNQRVFADAVQPGMAFAATEWRTEHEAVWLRRYDGNTALLTVVFSQDVEMPSELETQDVSMTFVVGQIDGPGGTAAVSGIAMTTGPLTSDQDPVFMVSELLSEDAFDAFAQLEKIRDGVEVIDTLTGVSYQIASAPSVSSLSFSSSDLSKFYCGCGLREEDTVDLDCVQAALNAYDIAIAAAKATAASCGKATAQKFAVCMAVAVGFGLVAGWLGASLTILGCFILAAIDTNQCVESLAISVDAAKATLKDALLACGMTLNEF